MKELLHIDRKLREEASSEEEKAVERLVSHIHALYGYDFSHYSKAFLKRRILRRVALCNLKNIQELEEKIRTDRNFFEIFLYDLFISVTELFRDPLFFKTLKTDILPFLKTQPLVKVWIAGCATGEEAYSMAILLKEGGMYDKSVIYATDISRKAILQAKLGTYSTSQIQLFTENYYLATGSHSFVDYYRVSGGNAIFDASLRKNIVFSDHNLVTDAPFGKMHLVLCRNVLIYFDRKLQDSVLNLLSNSLLPHGFLALGLKESIKFSSIGPQFEHYNAKERIFRKKLSLIESYANKKRTH